MISWNDTIAPEVYLPEGVFDDPLSMRLRPLRRLALAVVLETLSPSQNAQAAARRAEEDERWFLTTEGPMSFASVAELLKVDPEALADALRKYHGRRPPVRRVVTTGLDRVRHRRQRRPRRAA